MTHYDVTCPNCGHKQEIVFSKPLFFVLCLTIIGAIIYALVLGKRAKCKKCGFHMQKTKRFEPTPSQDEQTLKDFLKNKEKNNKE